MNILTETLPLCVGSVLGEWKTISKTRSTSLGSWNHLIKHLRETPSEGMNGGMGGEEELSSFYKEKANKHTHKW